MAIYPNDVREGSPSIHTTSGRGFIFVAIGGLCVAASALVLLAPGEVYVFAGPLRYELHGGFRALVGIHLMACGVVGSFLGALLFWRARA